MSAVPTRSAAVVSVVFSSNACRVLAWRGVTGVHKGEVLGLDFHPNIPKLLASGGADGDLFIWDIANASEPKPTRPHKVRERIDNPRR